MPDTGIVQAETVVVSLDEFYESVDELLALTRRPGKQVAIRGESGRIILTLGYGPLTAEVAAADAQQLEDLRRRIDESDDPTLPPIEMSWLM